LEMEQYRRLLDKNAAAPVEFQRASVAFKLAQLDLQEAQRRHEMAQHQHEQVKVRYEQFTLVAPVDGLIEDITAREGQMINAGEPVLRLLQNETLWVDLHVSLNRGSPLAID